IEEDMRVVGPGTLEALGERIFQGEWVTPRHGLDQVAHGEQRTAEAAVQVPQDGAPAGAIVAGKKEEVVGRPAAQEAIFGPLLGWTQGRGHQVVWETPTRPLR